MSELKKGDRCEIIAIGKKDGFHEKCRKELIGKKFRFIKQIGSCQGAFIGCDLKSETEIKLPKGTPKVIRKDKIVIFYLVKLKKI